MSRSFRGGQWGFVGDMKKTIIIICLCCFFCSAYSPENRVFPNKSEAQYYSASSNFKWIPSLYAFRCGDINETFDIGLYSVGFGKNSKASGYYSMVEGADCNSSGYCSKSWGDYCRAANHYATAWGSGSLASGRFSTAWGGGSIASALNATAWGGSVASGISSTSFGEQCNATATRSIAMGGLAKARATDAIAIGYDVNNVTEKSFAVGFSGIDLQVKHNEINIQDCNIIANGQTGVTADVNVVTDGSVITKLHFVKGIYVGRD